MVQIKGSITYNGHTFDEFIPERTASYIDQTDTHLAELTVRETFDFAARCQGTGHKAGKSFAPVCCTQQILLHCVTAAEVWLRFASPPCALLLVAPCHIVQHASPTVSNAVAGSDASGYCPCHSTFKAATVCVPCVICRESPLLSLSVASTLFEA